jgi:hypothetical protein
MASREGANNSKKNGSVQPDTMRRNYSDIRNKMIISGFRTLIRLALRIMDLHHSMRCSKIPCNSQKL